ncbi:MAG: hypothetical protein RL300_999, partial [Pseudomonadota bacterium]
MLIKTSDQGFVHPASSEITPEALYQSRRQLIRLMAGGVAGATLASWASREAFAQAWAAPGQNPVLV